MSRKDPPDAVIINLEIFLFSPRKHCQMALGSLSRGNSFIPWSSASLVSKLPAITRDSLFARAIFLPACMADTVGINPAFPEIALMTRSTSGHLIISSNAGLETIDLPIQLSITDGTLQGDINLDSEVNIVDVILLVNYILASEYADIADLNSDEVLNILDVVQLVNIILEF